MALTSGRWGKYIVRVASLPVAPLVSLLPRNPRVWVFGSWFGRRYADNSKYLFEAVVRTRQDVDAVWIAAEPDARAKAERAGGKAASPYSLRGIYYQLRAGVAVISVSLDDLSSLLTSGSKIVQMWHGTPLKRIGRDDDRFEPPSSGPDRWIRIVRNWFLRREWNRYWLFPAPSAEVADKLGGAFEIPPERMPVLGYPRNDLLCDGGIPADAVEQVLAELGRPPGSAERIISYLPTHRDEGRSSESLFPFPDMDAGALNEWLERHRAVLVFRRHFYHSDESGSGRVDRLVDASQSSLDTQLLLAASDVLITDVSSCYFDFLLTDRPIVFVTAELAEYMENERGLYYDFDEVSPGFHANTFAELIEALDTGVTNAAHHHAERMQILDLVYEDRSGDASSRVIEEIEARIPALATRRLSRV